MSNATRRNALAWTAGIALLLSSSASANAAGIGARVGRVNVPDTDEGATMIGAFLRSGSVLGMEGAVDYRTEKLGGGGELRTWPITASLVLQPIPLVYGLAGIGWYQTTLDFPAELAIEKKTESKVGYHVGAGVQFPVIPPLSLIADVRYAYIDYDFGDAVDAVSEFDGGNYVAIHLGAMFHFPS
ncbi:MAG TPA: outer membrane beta-barrel protein [bacterium]|nr:outer membrane beta-barrel protein [bacterium]